MNAILAFIKCLPEIIKLLEILATRIAEANTERKIKEDLQKINEAFEKRDATLLNDIFNN